MPPLAVGVPAQEVPTADVEKPPPPDINESSTDFTIGAQPDCEPESQLECQLECQPESPHDVAGYPV